MAFDHWKAEWSVIFRHSNDSVQIQVNIEWKKKETRERQKISEDLKEKAPEREEKTEGTGDDKKCWKGAIT